MSATDDKTTLLLSVGGSPQPIIHSIEQHKPQKLIYFCSRDSRQQIRAAIEPNLKHRAADAEIITTPDEQSLLASVQVLVRELPRSLANLGSDFSELQADFTGGTKAMSAAVVLALADRGCNFSYVGGVSRDKQGLGTVIDGRELMLHCDNPWDALGREPLKLFALHFNRCRFGSAQLVAETAARRSERLRPLFSTLKTLAEAYGRWDNFEHGQAGNLLSRCIQPLQTLPYLEEGAALSSLFASRLQKDIARLEAIKNAMSQFEEKKDTAHDGRALLEDLLANAIRRAEREHKYDDAVSRLYSVVEKAAKIRLKLRHGIDNSAVDREQVPADVRDAILDGQVTDDKGRYRLPLYRSYALLAALGDPLGEHYRREENNLRKVLDIRNHSLLAHGFRPIREETYRKLLAIALTFCDLEADQVPDFPELPEG